jgi:hypothetical protein
MWMLALLLGWLDPYDLFNSRELCAHFGVLHPKDIRTIVISPVMSAVVVSAEIAAFAALGFFVGRSRGFW